MSRFAIVGGPGQGKSTFGQYLCQLYRAAILRDRPPEFLDDHVSRILDQLEKQQKDVGGLPLTRRFPIRIELRNFAHALATEPRLTLIEYIRQDIARLGSATVLIEDLKSWLGQYPWVLVLDGLDEVPPSSNRSDVLREIEGFRVDAASQNSDMLMIATTRPQSYSKEFSEELFQHLYLTPLSPDQSLHYARKLAEARCGADARRKDELIRSLEKACKNPATSRLMQSPLQVTIMATLLEDIGEPPQQRYRLFAEYYRTIYKRETRRRLLEGILTERQKDIDIIHAHAGLMLQAAGEKTTAKPRRAQSDVDSALSDDQFRELVRRRLEQIGISAAKVSELLDHISDGSLQRLVFLVRPREGWVQFDITSFKEFMAAEAIMNGSDEDIRERLKVIAPASYWRNVFQFAVGKCFVDRDHLLDNLVSLCAGLNEDRSSVEIVGDETAGRAAKAVLWGARLALDILVDGTARQYPGYELRFARNALQLVRLADLESCARLASVFHDDLKELYVEVIEDRLGQTSFWSQLGAWHLLTSLAEREVSWAIEMIESAWPDDIEAQLAILFTRGRRFSFKWAVAKAAELAPKINPQWLAHYSTLSPTHISPDWGPLHSITKLLYGYVMSCETTNRSVWTQVLPELMFTPCHLGHELWESLKNVDFQNQNWLPFVAGARFGSNPSAKTLAAELHWLAENWEPNINARLSSLPWPLALCLDRVKSREDLLYLAQAAEKGLLGDSKHWNAAEQRWQDVGIGDDDFLTPSDDRLPLQPKFAEVGFPFRVSMNVAGDGYSATQLSGLIERLRQIADAETLSWLASVILNHCGYTRSRKSVISPDQFRELYSLASGYSRFRWRTYLRENFLSSVPSNSLDTEWVEFFDWLGREGVQIRIDTPRHELAHELIHHFCSNPEGRQGLLHIIADLAAAGSKCQVPKRILELAKSWGPLAKDDAIGLSLVNDDLTEDEIATLANELSKSDSLALALLRAVRMASNSPLEQVAKFALTLLTVLSETSSREINAADRAREVLNEFLTNRSSLLQDPTVWKRLNLPERL